MARPGRKPGFLINVGAAWHLVRERGLLLREAAAMLGCHRSTVSQAVNWEAARRGAPKTYQMDGRREAIARRRGRKGHA